MTDGAEAAGPPSFRDRRMGGTYENGSFLMSIMTEVLVLVTPSMEFILFTTDENSSMSTQDIHAMQSLSPVTSNTETTCGILEISSWTATTSEALTLTTPMNSKPSFM